MPVACVGVLLGSLLYDESSSSAQPAARDARPAQTGAPCGTFRRGLEIIDFQGARTLDDELHELFADGQETEATLAPTTGGPSARLAWRCALIESGPDRHAFSLRVHARTDAARPPGGAFTTVARASARPVWRRDAQIGTRRDSSLRVTVTYYVTRDPADTIVLCALRLGGELRPLAGYGAVPTVIRDEMSSVLPPHTSAALELNCNESSGTFLAQSIFRGPGMPLDVVESSIRLDVAIDRIRP